MSAYNGSNIDLNQKLAHELGAGYYHWYGSLTTPPCTEGVQWVLLRNPVFVAPADVARIKALEGANFRPTQPVNGRKVFWVHS